MIILSDWNLNLDSIITWTTNATRDFCAFSIFMKLEQFLCSLLFLLLLSRSLSSVVAAILQCSSYLSQLIVAMSLYMLLLVFFVRVMCSFCHRLMWLCQSQLRCSWWFFSWGWEALPVVFRMVDCSLYPLLILLLFLGVVVPSFVCGGYHNCPVLDIANTAVFTNTLRLLFFEVFGYARPYGTY
jgi:hypothetical protein